MKKSTVHSEGDTELRKQAEEELLLLTAMIEQSSEGIIRTDTEFRINYINDATRALYGWSLDELRGKTPDLFNVDQHADEIQNNIYTMVSSGKPYLGEALNVRKDGSTFYCQFKVSPLKNEKGEIYGSMSSVRDITDRKQVEEELKASSLATEASMNAIFAADLKGIITYANTSASKMWGYKCTEEMIGTNAIEYWTESTQGKAGEMIGTLLKEGNVATSGVLIGKRLDGTEFVVESNSVIMKDENGKPVGLIGSFSDITERKQTEGELLKISERLELAMDAGEHGFWDWNLDTNDVYFSPSYYTMLGYEPGELPMELETWINLMSPDDKKTIVPKVENCVKNARTYEVEFRLKTKDGNWKWISGKGKSFKKDIDGISHRALGVHIDITERKQAGEQLLETMESLRKAVSTTIQVMVSAVEARDPYTAGHQRRVADLARAIATEMGLPKEKIEGIRMAGSIHDIGKLSIPAEILSKPTRLLDIEFSMIKEHSRKGYEMLKDVESPWPLAEIVYQHHERMNGSGYPRNLKGDEILMEARIMAVADVVEAMASHRPYRPTLGIDAALKEIEDNRGILYDVDVVDICLRLFREKGFQLKDS